MSGLKAKRVVWTVIFLSVTLAAIVMECVAGLWHPAGTIPWTEYLARYVPWPIQLAAYVILAVWLPFHFWRHDHLRKDAFEQGRLIGRGEGHARGYGVGYTDGKQDRDREQRGNRPAGPSATRAAADRAMIQHAMDVGPVDWDKVRPGEPMCSHGYVFGRSEHHCGELPSGAVRFAPGRSDGR